MRRLLLALAVSAPLSALDSAPASAWGWGGGYGYYGYAYAPSYYCPPYRSYYYSYRPSYGYAPLLRCLLAAAVLFGRLFRSSVSLVGLSQLGLSRRLGLSRWGYRGGWGRRGGWGGRRW